MAFQCALPGNRLLLRLSRLQNTAATFGPQTFHKFSALTWLGSWRRRIATQSQANKGADAVLRFWLGEDYLSAPQTTTAADKQAIWYAGGPALDQECKEKFSGLLRDAEAGQLNWKKGYEGLAAVILMDQFSRNVYRNTPQMYALDEAALRLAKSIHNDDSTADLPPIHRVWLYLTHMHSEQLEDQELGIRRFGELLEEAKQLPASEKLQDSLQQNINYGDAHRKVIEQWGRFPHRNTILGRKSTPEETQAFAEGTIPSF